MNSKEETINLLNINRRLSKPRYNTILSAVVFVLMSIIYLSVPVINGWLNAPPQAGDGPDYDVIAFQIARGQGFSYDWDNVEFRAPYITQPDTYKSLLQRSGSAITATRPPLFPYLMAAIYSLFGRHFSLVRILNCLAMALACVITFRIVRRRFGVLPGLICCFLFALDGRIRNYAPQVMTESLACLLFSLVTWSLFHFVEERKWLWVILTGIFAGLEVLNRSIFIVALPFIMIIIYFLSTRSLKKLWNRTSVLQASLFLFISLLVNMPWMIRNCIITGEFYPLGTQGAINLSAGYSDQAIQNRGIWFSLTNSGFFTELTKTNTGFELELAKANYSQSAAIDWIQKNFSKVPILALLKIQDLWIPRSDFQVILLFLAIIGFFLFPRRAELFICAGLLLSNTIAVALTWSVGDRFQIPIIPILDICVSICIWSVFICITELRQSLFRAMDV
jgi:4-amino-4-deoxy-L-arabinose transferase-like glycosyltransferase